MSAAQDTLVVRAKGLSDPLGRTAVSVVTRLDLADEPPGRDLAELLAGIVGFQMRRLGADGTSAVPSLRGGSAAQIRFFLDGMPLPDAQTGADQMGLVPVQRLAAVEIHRGVVPSDLGGLGGIGAVNLITTDHQPGPSGQVELGAWGERAGRVSWGTSGNESVSGWLMLHGRIADNDFHYLDHNQTFHTSDDDTVRRRENAALREWGLLAAGSAGDEDFGWRASLGVVRRDGGRPGPLGYPSPHATVRRQRADARLHLNALADRLSLDLAAGRGDERLYDPIDNIGYAPPGMYRSLARDLGARFSVDLKPDTWVTALGLGVQWRGQWQRDWLVGIVDPDRQRHQVGAFGSVTIGGARLQVTPAWRWQRTEDNFPPVPDLPWRDEDPAVVNRRDGVSPSLGMVWQAIPGVWYVEAHGSTTVREPTWVELFGHRGGVVGNRELRPERINSTDLAVVLRRPGGGLHVRLAVFHAATDDKIIFFQNSQSTSEAINAAAVRTSGLELEAAVRSPGDWALTGNLTLQRAREQGGVDSFYDGHELPYMPSVEARIRLVGPVGSWRPWGEIVHQGRNYRDRANTDLNRAPERTLVNLGVSREWPAAWLGAGGGLTVGAELHNLTDNDIYDMEGFPLPGRSWRLHARVGR